MAAGIALFGTTIASVTRYLLGHWLPSLHDVLYNRVGLLLSWLYHSISQLIMYHDVSQLIISCSERRHPKVQFQEAGMRALPRSLSTSIVYQRLVTRVFATGLIERDRNRTVWTAYLSHGHWNELLIIGI